MPINLDIYCTKQPTLHDLVEPLKLKPAVPLRNYEKYVWTPLEGSTSILIALKKDPFIVSDAYDRECIDESIATARFAGLEIPQGLVQKLRRDNIINPGMLCTFIAQQNETGISIARPSCLEDDAYTLRADKELYELATEFPLLEGVDPWFKKAFGVAKFTKGEPTYEVSLETKVFAPEETLKHMAELAGYFAIAFNGIIYDPDNEEFGKPKSNKLHEEGMRVFMAFIKDANKKGLDFKPLDF